MNRNKRSLTLDLRKPEGRDVFLQLAAKSDFVVENFRPGTLAGWGLGYADVRRVRPDVIYVSITGFGQFGPDHDRAGYDPIAQARSGYMSLNGSRDGDPMKSTTWLADDLGGMHGALAALAALAHRTRTGEGQQIDVALLDGLLATSNANPTLGALGRAARALGQRVQLLRAGERVPLPRRLDLSGRAARRALEGARARDRPAGARRRPGFATTAQRVANRAEANRLVEEFCAARPVAEAERLCAAAGLTAGAVRSYAESARDPHVLARDMLQSGRAGGRAVRADHRPRREALAHAAARAQRRTRARRAQRRDPRRDRPRRVGAREAPRRGDRLGATPLRAQRAPAAARARGGSGTRADRTSRVSERRDQVRKPGQAVLARVADHEASSRSRARSRGRRRPGAWPSSRSARREQADEPELREGHVR